MHGFRGFVDHDTPGTACPMCEIEFDGAMGITSGKAPSEGDVSICVYCGSFSTFDDQGHLRVPTDGELVAYTNDPQLRAAQQVIRARVGQHGSR